MTSPKIDWHVARITARDFLMLVGGIAIAVYLPTMALPIAILTGSMLAGILFLMYHLRTVLTPGARSQRENPTEVKSEQRTAPGPDLSGARVIGYNAQTRQGVFEMLHNGKI